LIEAMSSSADPHMPPKGPVERCGDCGAEDVDRFGAKWNRKALGGDDATGEHAADRLAGAAGELSGPVLCMAPVGGSEAAAVGRGDRIVLYDLSARGGR